MTTCRLVVTGVVPLDLISGTGFAVGRGEDTVDHVVQPLVVTSAQHAASLPWL